MTIACVWDASDQQSHAHPLAPSPINLHRKQKAFHSMNRVIPDFKQKESTARLADGDVLQPDKRLAVLPPWGEQHRVATTIAKNACIKAPARLMNLISDSYGLLSQDVIIALGKSLCLKERVMVPQ